MSNRAAAKFQLEERSSPGRWAGFLYALRVALRVRRERRLLLRMDERMLKDLGLSGIAHAEASRSFWDVPVDRLRCRADVAGDVSRRGSRAPARSAGSAKSEQQRMRAA
jgi:uncharacterized protein YjiS (DUF1127 family)